MAKTSSISMPGRFVSPAERPGFRLFAALALVVLVAPAPLHAEDQETRISKIKCAYLLNFVKFTEWPAKSFESDDTPIRFTVVGPAKDHLLESTFEGAVIGGRKVELRRLIYPEPDPWTGRPDAPAIKEFFRVLEHSHVVFINAHENSRVAQILEQLQGLDILTVSTVPRFAEQGGMLGLVPRDNRIVFDANVDAIERTQIKVSSKVLRLAKIVKTEGE